MATFGKTDVGSSAWNFATGYTYACRYHLDEDGVVTVILVYNGNESAFGLVRVGIYDESEGLPNNRVAVTDTKDAIFGWNSFNGLNVPLSAGYYWIAVYFAMEQASGMRYDAGESGQLQYKDAEMPNPFGVPDLSSDRAISIYAVYTLAVRVSRVCWEDIFL